MDRCDTVEMYFSLVMKSNWFLQEKASMTSKFTFDSHGTGPWSGTSLWLRLNAVRSFFDSVHPSTVIRPLKNARAALFLIKRSFVFPTPSIFIPLYITLVRLHHEFSCPHLKKNIDYLMRLQCLPTRILNCYRSLCIEERFRNLTLLCLLRWKLSGDLTFAYRTVPWIYSST